MAATSLILASMFVQGAAVPCDPSAAGNRRLVEQFYTMVLVDKQVRKGFETFVRTDFVEHKPDVPKGDRDSVIDYLEALVKDVPDARWTIVRTIAEGDLVALHVRFSPASGAPEYALADFFRVKDCRIAEHWDVVGPPPKDSQNPNPRF